MAVCGISSTKTTSSGIHHLAILPCMKRENVLLGRGLVLLQHDDQQRPLVPFRMAHADHRGFGHLGMADRQVLQVDRGDPFAARLDHVLGAVGDLHVAVAVDGRDVAGVEEAVLVEDRDVVLLEIGARDGEARAP